MRYQKFLASFILVSAVSISAIAQDQSAKHADYFRGVEQHSSSVIRVARFTPLQPKQDPNTRQLTTPGVQSLALDRFTNEQPVANERQPVPTKQSQFQELGPSTDNDQVARATVEPQPNQSGLEPVFEQQSFYQPELGMNQPQPTRWTPNTNSFFQGPQKDEWVGFCHCCSLDEIRRYGCNGTNGCCDNGDCGTGCCQRGCRLGQGRCGGRQAGCGCGCGGDKFGSKRCECKERRTSRRACRQACRQQSQGTECGCGCADGSSGS